MFDASRRPIGRLSYWVMAAVMMCGLARTASGAGAAPPSVPATTTVADTVYLADGNPAQGNLIITWPPFLTASGTAIAGGTKNVALGTSGALSVALVPNVEANPAGVYYTVVYQLGPGQTKTEYWMVPTTSPANLAAVRVTPGSGMAGQPVSMQYVNSELATKADDSAVVHLGGTETISGAKTFAAAPSVPAPTSTGQVANKGYVDASISNVGAGNYLSTAGGTMTGPILLPANPVSALQAATKQYVDQGFSAKADLISGLVPASELGTGSASAGNCLLGNGTWGACGSGGGPTGVANGSALVSNGVGQAAVYQAKPVIDVRDYGVVGDGCGNASRDDTVAFQNAVNAAIGTPHLGKSGRLIIPGSSCVNVASTINIVGGRGLVIECLGAQGQSVNTCGINWIGPAGGTVLFINKTRDSTFQGFYVSTGSVNPGTANVAIDVDETGATDGITTHNKFKDITIFQYPTVNPNFVGMRFGDSAPGNVEGMDIENVSVWCRGTPTGLNQTGTAFKVGKNGGGSEPFFMYFHGSQGVGNCSIGWDLQGNNRLVIIDGGLTGGNYTLLNYESGAQAQLKNLRDEGSTIIASMLSGAADLTVENLSLSGLVAGTTSFDLTNAAGGNQTLRAEHAMGQRARDANLAQPWRQQ